MPSNIRFMHNQEHYSLIVLGYAVFLYGSHNLALIEAGQLPLSNYLMSFVLCTLGLCLFTNSILTVYLRAMKVVNCEQGFKKTSHKIDYGKQEGGNKRRNEIPQEP